MAFLLVKNMFPVFLAPAFVAGAALIPVFLAVAFIIGAALIPVFLAPVLVIGATLLPMLFVPTKNTKRGRPVGRTKDRPMQMRVTDEFIAEIDDWRRNQPDLPNRTETIRRMFAQVLASSRKR
jgi:hypothetical protein